MIFSWCILLSILIPNGICELGVEVITDTTEEYTVTNNGNIYYDLYF